MNFPNVKYTSGLNFNSAVACSTPVYAAPLDGVNDDVVLTQDFICNFNDYAPLALNTAHDELTDYYLVSEGEKRDLGGGKIRWTRTYAKIPATYSEPVGNYTYQFIGLSLTGSATLGYAEGRYRFTRNVEAVMTHEFHMVGAGETYESADEIPLEEVTKYYYSLSDEQELETDYLYDSPPATSPTVPTREEYVDMIADDAIDSTSYSIVVESSKHRWNGNIWRVDTLRIKAI